MLMIPFKRTVVIFSLFTLFPVNESLRANQWTLQNSGVTSHLFTVDFVDDTTGYSAGDSGVIIKTTDGGMNWTRLNSPTLQPVSSLCFLNRDTGWIGGNQGIIYITTDGGMSWSYQNSKTTLDISSLFFLNERRGWGVTLTGNPVYLYTTNGGAVWDTVKRVGFPINSVMFIDSLTGYSSGGRFDWLGFVNYSEDGGRNWSSPQSVDLEIMFDVVFLNKYFGITVGGDHDFFGSLAYQTFDGGKTWLRQSVTDSVPSPLTAISFMDADHAWVCGYGKIYKVSPAVQLWELQTDTLTRWTWYDNSFVSPDRGWFSGANGRILHYDKHSVSVEDRKEEKKRFILHSNYPNPFNPGTTIRFSLQEKAHARLVIFNALGQRVRTLYSGTLLPGEHRLYWNGDDDRMHNTASGIYIYQLRINHSESLSRKMILIR